MNNFNFFTFEEQQPKQNQRVTFEQLREMLKTESSGSYSPVSPLPSKDPWPLQGHYIKFQEKWQNLDLNQQKWQNLGQNQSGKVQDLDFESAFGAWYAQNAQNVDNVPLTLETSNTSHMSHMSPRSTHSERRPSYEFMRQRRLSNASQFLSDFASELGSFDEDELQIVSACIDSREDEYSSYTAPIVINPQLQNILQQLSTLQCDQQLRSIDRVSYPIDDTRPTFEEVRSMFLDAVDQKLP